MAHAPGGNGQMAVRYERRERLGVGVLGLTEYGAVVNKYIRREEEEEKKKIF